MVFCKAQNIRSSLCFSFFRQLLGFSILPTMGLINGFLASWLAILVESPKRRPLLSLYLTNLASF